MMFALLAVRLGDQSSVHIPEAYKTDLVVCGHDVG